jgi:Zn-dependent M16 (insulinase) family peptidase
MGSPATLRSVEDLRRDFDARFGVLAQSVERIRDQLLDRRRWTVSFTGTDRVFDALARRLAEWSDRTRGAPPADAPHPFNPAAAPPREGLAGPVNVAYCATVMPAPPPSHPDAPLLALGAWLLRFDYCLPEIRLKGNAYHAGAQYDDAFGLFKLFSGEDPRLVETLEVFERVGDFVRKAPWTQADIDRAIIGASKDADPPLRPAEATGLALTRHVRGDTDECRDRRYEARLQATPAEVRRALLEHLEAGAPRAAVCVVSSRDRLEAANRLLGPRALAIADILP